MVAGLKYFSTEEIGKLKVRMDELRRQGFSKEMIARRYGMTAKQMKSLIMKMEAKNV